MLIPYGTDAPIYHRPFGTIAVIAINVAMFLATGMGDNESHRWLILEFDRINPLQWVTAAFMHASWVHLVSNMIFLWCFGLVVEGKIGWRRFSLLYLGLALADGAIGQIPMFILHSGSIFPCGALGASGVIFALIAIAMVWAPENEMSCLFIWSFFFVRTVDIPIYGLSAFYVAIELLEVFFFGFSMSSAMLHLLGLSVGFPFAIYMLKKDLVDCEGFDWFSRHPAISMRLSSFAPLTWFGGMVFGTPARDSAQLALSQYSNKSSRDAMEQIRQNPDAFNPQPTKPVPLATPKPIVRQAKRAKKQTPQTSANGIADLAKRLVTAIASEDTHLAKKCFMQIDQASERSTRFAGQTDLDELPNTVLPASVLPASVLSDKVLGHYANLLARHNEHLESIRPLELLIDRRSVQTNQACLQVALIHWQLRHDAASAKRALGRMTHNVKHELDRKRRRLLAKIGHQVTDKKRDVPP